MTTKITKSHGRKAGDLFGCWVLEYVLGQGGNGEVWQVRGADNTSYALKILNKSTSESLKRFKIEIEALGKISDIEGIVPLIDQYDPKLESGETPWFVMPLGKTFDQYKSDKPVLEIIKDFIGLANTLNELHLRGYSHRDIKPANILYINGRLSFSDFGLVKFPEREDITPEKRDIGAKFTMAPEMRRQAADADGKLADVYSFIKSLWIAISGEELGFDGQYNPDSSLSLNRYLDGLYTTPLDQLLVECTNTEPRQRPEMSFVRDRIVDWISITEDFQRRNELEWVELNNKLFPFGRPSSTTWSGIDEICTVLTLIAGAPSLNHMFYPSGGGMTMLGASRSFEPEMIELKISPKMVDIIKPRKLTFESFRNDLEWSYFRLEAYNIEPSGCNGAVHSDGVNEELTEIEPGYYAPPSCWEYDEFEGEPLPHSARRVNRILKGCLVFFSTTSIYNKVSDTYDARHNKMTETEFRKYIENSVKAFEKYREENA